MLNTKEEATAATMAPKNESQEESYRSPCDNTSTNLFSRWFSKLLRDARDEALVLGNIHYAQYLEGLLKSSDDRMGGEAA